jgi:predicted methyltransferase
MRVSLQNALSISHLVMKAFIQPGDTVIDGTMGRGRDTLFLSNAVGPTGKVYSFDIQEQALAITRALLIDSGSHQNYELIHDSHENADKHVTGMIDAAMFNLGYMPGGDHSITTNAVSTLSAIKVCMGLLKPLGIITICVYYGHTEGLEEKKQLIDFLVNVDNKAFAVSKLDFLNQPNAPPQLIFIQKNK